MVQVTVTLTQCTKNAQEGIDRVISLKVEDDATEAERFEGIAHKMAIGMALEKYDELAQKGSEQELLEFFEQADAYKNRRSGQDG